MGKEPDKEDERKEAAIASTPCLQPNYKPRRITQDQLSKFQVLLPPHISTEIEIFLC